MYLIKKRHKKNNDEFPLVFDAVAPEMVLNEVYNDLINSRGWSYNNYSEGNILFMYKLFNPNTSYFNDNTPAWVPNIIPLVDNLTSNRYDLKSHKVVLSHFNGQLFEQDGNFHCDSDHSIVFCINPTWNKEWGGEFEYINSDNEIIQVDYKPGRLILLNSNIVHRGLGPKIKKNILRVTLAIHLSR